MLDYKSILSDIQYQAVVNYKGASLVIAGAGSGKTRVLTYRIAYMIESGVAPQNILSLTFTNKAAGEMRERIQSVVGYDRGRYIEMGTFHGVFRRILSREAELLGFTNSFTIYQTSDSRNLVKTIVKEMQLDEKKYEPKLIFNKISKLKNDLVTPNIYVNNSAAVGDDIKSGLGEFHNIYKSYMIRCKQNNAMDFDDLLLYTNILFKSHPQILEKYQQLYQYILVDEYQDTNSSQYLILKKLAQGHNNICVVGDDAQSIYSFRGARIENILRFQKDYPSSHVVRLEENYRSTQTIVNAANEVISKNKNQLKKSVFSNKSVGEKISLRRAYTDREEAMIIRKEIAQAHRGGVEYGDMAILYRNNAQSKPIEDQLRLAQIPYRIHKGHSFYEQAEIKSALAYVRLVCNQADNEALSRIINYPTRGIGNTSLDKIKHYAAERNISLWDAITVHPLTEMGVKGAALKSIASFIAIIENHSKMAKECDAYETVLSLMNESGVINMFRGSKDPEKESAYQNIEELTNSLKQQCESYAKENLEILKTSEWIQDIVLMTAEEAQKSTEERNQVTLMTIHSAKGLEYHSVFIAGVEEGMFPSAMSVESQHEIEEERRLFYVAVTRAVNSLTVSYSLSRYKWGTPTNTIPSRFIAEISECYYDCPELRTSKGAYDNEDSPPQRISFQARQSNDASGGQQNRYANQYSSRPSGSNPTTSSRPSTSTLGMTRVGTRSSSTVSVGSVCDLSVGDRVRHERFGAGVIKSMEATATDTRICVGFDDGCEKNLLYKFAKLRKI